MYQLINEILVNVVALIGILRNFFSEPKTVIIKSFHRINKSYRKIKFSQVFFTASGVTLSLLLAFMSVKLFFYSLPATAVKAVAVVTAFGAGYIVLQVINWVLAVGKLDELKSENCVFKEHNIQLQHDIQELVTHSNIASAAVNSATFDCFINSIASLLRKDKNAHELTVFTQYNERIIPHTYYQLSDFSELCLSFSTNAIVNSEKLDLLQGHIYSNYFEAEELTISYSGENIVIIGKLHYDGIEVGSLRVTMINSCEDNFSFKELLQGIVKNALLAAKIDTYELNGAMAYTEPVVSNLSSGIFRMLLQLKFNEMLLGVVRVGFNQPIRDNLSKEKKLLVATASHIGKALYNEKIYELAIKDGLTNLYNKRYLLETLQQYFRTFIRNNAAFSFIIIDIDHFKKVNDTWGHVIGDVVLKRIATVISEVAREADIVCRYGGEELAILLPETELEGARRLAERIRYMIESQIFTSTCGEEFGVTASLGIVEVEQYMLNIESIIELADKALYEAKNAGRNRVVIHNKYESPVSIVA